MKRMTHNKKGFTIIELMIAMTVLSVILLLVTVMISSIGRLYYKGANQARIQSDARSIVDEVSQNLKLSNKMIPFEPPSGTSAYCINNIRYSFVTGVQLGSGTGKSRHVLWRDINPNPGTCTPISNLNVNIPSTTGSELVSPKSRLVRFKITPSASGPYTVDVALAFGDSDLLTAASKCKSGASSQFCATAAIKTNVMLRIK